jgi:hypothetical protein
MERVDHWVVDGKTIDTPVMGAFEVAGDKITAWREYFTPPGNSSRSERSVQHLTAGLDELVNRPGRAVLLRVSADVLWLGVGAGWLA